MTQGIRWMSLVPGSGYGNASRDYLSGLRAAGVPLTWTPLGWDHVLSGSAFGPLAEPHLEQLEHGDLVGRTVAHDTVIVHATPFWHDWLAREAAGRRLVAYSTWETDRLPPEWVATLNRYDAVLVPSQLNRSVFVASGVSRPVEVVPHALRPAPSVPGPARSAPDEGRPLTFYLIATWTTRKAILDTIEAFVRAFDDADAVRLVIQSGPTDLISQRAGRSAGPPRRQDATWISLARALAGRSRLPEIVLRTKHLDEEAIDALHAEGDCFVLLSRGEGWGLGAFDAAAAGNPVVLTGWGGSPEYLPAGYPYLVDYDLAPTSWDPPDLFFEPRAGERWARARLDHAAGLLRRVYEQWDEAARWARRAQDHIRARYRPEQVTRRLLAAVASAHSASPAAARR